MKSTMKWTIVLSVAVLFGATTTRAEFIIDTFDTSQGPFFIFANPPIPSNPVSDATNAAEAVGGERDIELLRTSPTPGIVTAAVNVIDPGKFAYGSQSAAGTALIAWDGDDNNGSSSAINYTGLGGIDVTQGGANTHLKLSAGSDLGDDIVVTFFTNAGNASSTTLMVPATGNNVYQEFLIPLASFVAILGGGADFMNIGAITMLVDGSAVSDLDLKVDLISVIGPSAVPEPSLISLGGIGVLIFGIRKWLMSSSKKSPSGVNS